MSLVDINILLTHCFDANYSRENMRLKCPCLVMPQSNWDLSTYATKNDVSISFIVSCNLVLTFEACSFLLHFTFPTSNWTILEAYFLMFKICIFYILQTWTFYDISSFFDLNKALFHKLVFSKKIFFFNFF